MCPWKEAIVDACVVDWILTAEHETNPRKAINDLLCWQQKLALDPAISEEAHKLHARIVELESAGGSSRLRALAIRVRGMVLCCDDSRHQLTDALEEVAEELEALVGPVSVETTAAPDKAFEEAIRHPWFED